MKTRGRHSVLRRRLKAEQGFSLIELLVAMAVFSIAALALLETQGRSLKTAGELELRTMAGMVADNRVAEFLGSRLQPTPGRSSGTETLLGTTFEWRENRVAVRGTQLLTLTVSVSVEDGAQYASLTAFRRVE